MNTYVRDIMTAGVVVVRPDTPYRKVAAMLRDHRVSGFPVTGDDGTVVGVVTETDLLALAAGRHRRGHRAAEQATAADLMSHPAVTVGPSARSGTSRAWSRSATASPTRSLRSPPPLRTRDSSSGSLRPDRH